jgi:hypothetical protein
VLRVSSYVSFMDRGVDYPAAAVLQLARGVQRHAPERFPWEPLEQFCRSVSPDQIRWLEIGTEWVQSRRFWYSFNLIGFYRLYHGVLRGQGRPIVERGGEVRFARSGRRRRCSSCRHSCRRRQVVLMLWLSQCFIRALFLGCSEAGWRCFLRRLFKIHTRKPRQMRARRGSLSLCGVSTGRRDCGIMT